MVIGGASERIGGYGWVGTGRCGSYDRAQSRRGGCAVWSACVGAVLDQRVDEPVAVYQGDRQCGSFLRSTICHLATAIVSILCPSRGMCVVVGLAASRCRRQLRASRATIAARSFGRIAGSDHGRIGRAVVWRKMYTPHYILTTLVVRLLLSSLDRQLAQPGGPQFTSSRTARP